MLKIVQKTKIWFGISLTIILIGLFSMATKGFEYGIDFKGGTVVDINMTKAFNKTDVDTIIKKYVSDFQSVTVDNTSLEIKSSNVDSNTISAMIKDITTKYKGSSLTTNESIGASIGSETKVKAAEAVALAVIAILIYIAIRFEFKFGIAAILSLIHDVLIMLTVYSVFRLPIDSTFIAAMLTVIGYSVHDTIVVFDRIRENQKFLRKADVVLLANASVTQTMARSINTVLTVLITLTSVYIFVPSIRNFTGSLLIGITSGAYSSIFIASPFWVILKKRADKKRHKMAIVS